MLNSLRRPPTVARGLHTSSSSAGLAQKRKLDQPSSHGRQPPAVVPERARKRETDEVVRRAVRHVKRNELGVQMLSRVLHQQVFKNAPFLAPDPACVQIARDHLQMHGLDPKQGSHFHCIGLRSAQPWISLAKDLSSSELPPKPEHFDIQSGWTKYYYRPDGSSYSEHVDYPHHGGKAEEMLVFDVETMPPYHPYAVMACAASKNAWYSWISPWLLGETEETQHLIPLGEPGTARVVVGHNVSYDRQRILEEYSLKGTQTRFLDTMSLHVAVKGISSHQRPAWIKHRKAKAEQVEQRVEAVEAVLEIMRDAESQEENEVDAAKRAKLRHLRAELEESLPTLQEDDSDANDAELSNKRWEGSNEIRGDFMKASREDIRADIHDYLNYCAHDVYVTHQVFSQVLPAFLERCPSPVSFAGILTMGSSFLTVNESWEEYLRSAERTYQELEVKVKKHLADLAEEAKDMMEGDSWKESPWLAQLDWTPKVAGKSRGVYVDGQVSEPTPKVMSSTIKSTEPVWLRDIIKNGAFSPPSVNRVLPVLLKLSFEGHPLQYTTAEKWHFHSAGKKKTLTVLGTSHGVPYLYGCTTMIPGSVNWTGNQSLPLLPPNPTISKKSPSKSPRSPKPQVLWPKWYWDLAKPKKDLPPGTLDDHRSKSHLPNSPPPVLDGTSSLSLDLSTRARLLEFLEPADDPLHEMTQGNGEERYVFYKLPHKDGEKANVGSPLAKTFMKYSQDGTLNDAAIGLAARDRILNQMVVWQNEKQKWGMILPQVITMGTVTRRAIEKTWLTASNAKKNRVGSELKAMVRAPKGYAIVGADVDSEELWISSCMGDAQFGLHGATAIGWMTLEGTKAAGTDLHSKTASILGISRDQGEGVQLLAPSARMQPEEAKKLAENLYSSTKGKNTHLLVSEGRRAFVFNKLEEIALSDHPQTPALGCGITAALSKENLPADFGSDYMTSRINWVVQSSGQYDINARFLISVHDELRYLVADEDRYPNLWTRCLFAFKLGMDDLPQGVAFFSAVDIDHVLRKEVDMPCVTPSHPTPIPPGESMNVVQTLEKTNGGSLWRDGRPMRMQDDAETLAAHNDLTGYTRPDCLVHRTQSAAFLRAQATNELAEVKHLAQQATGVEIDGGVGKNTKGKRGPRRQDPPVDRKVWDTMQEVLNSGHHH
ncbi:hypothetical protein BU15DRAFT_85762 [Melanogaster broomeanus]|nr:hypothetical protein BU15DRAFT_85762 [Melanogaster broomeanus]